MIVMKFGGSSVANAERIKHVASIIKAYREKRPVVVLSAMGDTTDHLLAAADLAVTGTVDVAGVAKLHEETARELGINIDAIEALLSELKQLLTGISMLKEISRRSRDYLVSFGERMSVRMMAAYLKSQGVDAKFYDAWDIGFVSDSNYMAAELLDEVWENIPRHLGSYSRAGQCYSDCDRFYCKGQARYYYNARPRRFGFDCDNDWRGYECGGGSDVEGC